MIVVLTDGSNNRGVDPQTAAKQAAGRGVRVFTIGYGTDNPAPLACSSDQFGGFGGGGGGGASAAASAAGPAGRATRSTPTTARSCRSPGPPAARSTARRTPASSAAALAKLPAAFTIVRKHVDIASWFAAGGGLLIAAAVALSLWWNRTRRVPAPARSVDH